MSELGLMLFSSVPVWHNEYNDHLTPIRLKRTSHQAANIRCFDQKIQPGPSFQGCAKVVAPAGTLPNRRKGRAWQPPIRDKGKCPRHKSRVPSVSGRSSRARRGEVECTTRSQNREGEPVNLSLS